MNVQAVRPYIKSRLPCSNTIDGARGEVNTLKGYYLPSGYMGLVNGRYILFATESDYHDYMTM